MDEKERSDKFTASQNAFKSNLRDIEKLKKELERQNKTIRHPLPLPHLNSYPYCLILARSTITPLSPQTVSSTTSVISLTLTACPHSDLNGSLQATKANLAQTLQTLQKANYLNERSIIDEERLAREKKLMEKKIEEVKEKLAETHVYTYPPFLAKTIRYIP